MVAAVVVLVVGAMAFLTLYLPAAHAARQGNVVRIDGLTVRMSAQADPAYNHGVDLDFAIEPPLDPSASVEVAPVMPTMGNMFARVASVSQVDPGAYVAVADLGMGGLWQVQVRVRRPGQRDTIAHFRLNA
jgi:hypothetical protein